MSEVDGDAAMLVVVHRERIRYGGLWQFLLGEEGQGSES